MNHLLSLILAAAAGYMLRAVTRPTPATLPDYDDYRQMLEPSLN